MERIDQATNLITMADMKTLSEKEDLSIECKKMLVSFANFLRLNDSDDNTVRSCKSALRSFGKILSTMTYVKYDEVSAEQMEEALTYSAQVRIDAA